MVHLGLGGETWRSVVLGRNADNELRVSVLVFVGGEGSPSFVIKLSSSEADVFGQERENLELLHELGKNRGGVRLPQLLWTGEILGHRVLVQSAVAGIRLKNLPASHFECSAHGEELRRLVDLLVDLHDRVADRDGHPTGVAARIAEYRDRLEVSRVASRVLDEVETCLDGRALPRSPWHGDFCTANVLVAQESAEVAVIDWEYRLEPALWPCGDLFYFLASRPQGFDLWRPDAPADVALRSLVTALGLPVELLPPLAVMTWVELSLRKLDECRSSEQLDGWLPLIRIQSGQGFAVEELASRWDDVRARFPPEADGAARTL